MSSLCLVYTMFVSLCKFVADVSVHLFSDNTKPSFESLRFQRTCNSYEFNGLILKLSKSSTTFRDVISLQEMKVWAWLYLRHEILMLHFTKWKSYEPHPNSNSQEVGKDKQNQTRSYALMPDKCVYADKENGIIFAVYGEHIYMW